MTARTRTAARLCGATTAAVAAAGLLLRLGDALPPPPDSPLDWSNWAERVGVAHATFSLLRLAGLVVAGYLAVCFALAAVGSLCALPRLVVTADRLSFGSIRRVCAASTAGIVLSTSALSGVAGAHDVHHRSGQSGAETPTAAVTMRLVEDAADHASPVGSAVSTSVAMRLVDPTDEHGAEHTAPVVMRLIEPAAPVGSPEAVLPGAAPPDLDAAAPAQRLLAGAATEHGLSQAGAPTTGVQYVVQPGDHLWSIAARALDAADDRAIDEYWRQLVTLNRDVLADPDNPDLLFAGQLLRLPTQQG